MSTDQGHVLWTICNRLKEERERLNLSQADVYARLLVSRGTYIKYESGETSPTARHLAVLDLLDFDIYYIVTGERAVAVSPEEQRLLSGFRAMDTTARAGVLALAAAFDPGAPQAAEGLPDELPGELRPPTSAPARRKRKA